VKKVDPRASTMAVVQKNVRVWAFSFNMEARDPFMGDDPNQVRAARIAVKGRLPGQVLFRQNQLTWVAHRCSRHAFPRTTICTSSACRSHRTRCVLQDGTAAKHDGIA
jgi:hypothetical protein